MANRNSLVPILFLSIVSNSVSMPLLAMCANTESIPSGGNVNPHDWAHFNPYKFEPANKLVPSSADNDRAANSYLNSPTFPHDPTRQNVIFGRGKDSLPTAIYAHAHEILQIASKYYQAPAAGESKTLVINGESITLYGTSVYTPLQDNRYVANPAQLSPFDPTRVFYKEKSTWPIVIYASPGQQISILGQKFTVPGPGQKQELIFGADGKLKNGAVSAGSNVKGSSGSDHAAGAGGAGAGAGAGNNSATSAGNGSGTGNNSGGGGSGTGTVNSNTSANTSGSTASTGSGSSSGGSTSGSAGGMKTKPDAEAVRIAQEEAARKSQEEATKRAQEEATKKAQEEAAKKAQEEAQRAEEARKTEQEKQAAEEAAKQAAQEEANRQAAEEANAEKAAEQAAQKRKDENNKWSITDEPNGAKEQSKQQKCIWGFSGHPMRGDKNAKWDPLKFCCNGIPPEFARVDVNLRVSRPDNAFSNMQGLIKYKEQDIVLILSTLTMDGKQRQSSEFDPKECLLFAKKLHKSRPKQGSASDEFYQKVVDAYNELPEKVKQWLDDHGYSIRADEYGPTDSYAAHREGEIVLGEKYTEQGQERQTDKFVDIFGALAHEIGHALDNFYQFSSSDAFKAAYDRDVTSNLHGRDMSSYREGSDQSTNAYLNNGAGEDGKPTTRGKQEVAADLMSRLMGAGGGRAGDVSAAFSNTYNSLNSNTSASQYVGTRQPSGGKK